jgi:DNA-nicking Smr family endonuclease
VDRIKFDAADAKPRLAELQKHFPTGPFLLEFPRMDEPVQLPIDGVLDLHAFQPREVADLIASYLAECQARGILRVRIIHGKGLGSLRRTVHALLGRHPDVISFALAGEHLGGWGATIVHLCPRRIS